MRGNPGLEFIVLDFGTKRPRVRIPPLRLLEGLIYEDTEKGALFLQKGTSFSVLLENLANRFRLASIFRVKTKSTHYQAGMKATILFIFTTTAVR